MAEAPPPQAQPVEIDPDFEPLSRPRSCTWPLPRPELTDPASSNTSSPAPSVQQEPGGNIISNLGLLEEDYGEYAEQKAPCGVFQCRDGNCVHLHHHQHQQHHHLQQLQAPQPQQQVPPPGVPPLGGSGQRKSSSSRRNAWGNMSYADLITKAIDSSPEKRLTLSQIYDWMVKSVPYFKDKGDSNSSAGWKVSVCLRAGIWLLGGTRDGFMTSLSLCTARNAKPKSKTQSLRQGCQTRFRSGVTFSLVWSEVGQTCKITA